MERFITTENIKNYRLLLSDPEIEKDPVRRVMLVRLLAEEMAKDTGARQVSREADQLETEPLVQQPELSGIKYWAARHRAKP